jgi:carbonic anhydrase
VSSLDVMLERNKVFAAQQSEKHTLMPSLPQAMPNLKAVIIGCADMRVDPANLLGLEPGEVVVMRNIGGRVTPGLLEQLGLLGRIGQVAGAIPGGGGEFHLIILQHTDCGITRLVGDPAMLTNTFEYQKLNSRQKRSLIHERRLRATLLCYEPFQHCHPNGSSPASSMMWQQDSLKSSYRHRRFDRLTHFFMGSRCCLHDWVSARVLA